MKHTQYKIGVITNVNGPSMIDLKQVADDHQIVFDTIPFSVIPIDKLEDSSLFQRCLQYDIIYYRTGLRDTIIYLLAELLVRQGIPVINAGLKHHRLHRKIQQSIIAAKCGITQPRSAVVYKLDYSAIKSLLGKPFIVKPDYGSKGNGIKLIRTKKDFDTLDRDNLISKPNLYQEFIQGADEYRVYTVGNKAVASYRKTLGKGEFRANLHAGGGMLTTEPERKKVIHDFAAKVARAFGADLSGVDLLYRNGQCIFIELNWQPGWENLDKMSGKNFSEITLQYLLNRAHRHKLVGDSCLAASKVRVRT